MTKNEHEFLTLTEADVLWFIVYWLIHTQTYFLSDEDRQEAIQALSQLFDSIADVTSRIMLNSVTARRNLYHKDIAFKNKAIKNKLFRQSAIGPKQFGGNFFFFIFYLFFFWHSSAENLTDVKENQNPRDLKRRDSKEKLRTQEVLKTKIKHHSQFLRKEILRIMKGETSPKVAHHFVVEPKEDQTLRSQNTINLGFIVPESNTPERNTDSTCGKQTDGTRREMEKITSHQWVLNIVKEGLQFASSSRQH